MIVRSSLHSRIDRNATERHANGTSIQQQRQNRQQSCHIKFMLFIFIHIFFFFFSTEERNVYYIIIIMILCERWAHFAFAIGLDISGRCETVSSKSRNIKIINTQHDDNHMQFLLPVCLVVCSFHFFLFLFFFYFFSGFVWHANSSHVLVSHWAFTFSHHTTSTQNDGIVDVNENHSLKMLLMLK